MNKNNTRKKSVRAIRDLQLGNSTRKRRSELNSRVFFSIIADFLTTDWRPAQNLINIKALFSSCSVHIQMLESFSRAAKSTVTSRRRKKRLKSIRRHECFFRSLFLKAHSEEFGDFFFFYLWRSPQPGPEQRTWTHLRSWWYFKKHSSSFLSPPLTEIFSGNNVALSETIFITRNEAQEILDAMIEIYFWFSV